MRAYILGFLVWIVYRSLTLTWRMTFIEPETFTKALENREPFLLAHWHGDELPLVQLTPRYRIATMTSNSKDGAIMTVVVRLFGGKTSRGSSSRGGATGLKGLIRLMRQGYTCSLAVDGPKGPYHKVKPGIFEMSRLLGLPVYVGGVACDRAWHFEKAWNKAFLPKPFARVVVSWKYALPAVSKDLDARSTELAQLLEGAMHHAHEEAQKKLEALTAQC